MRGSNGPRAAFVNESLPKTVGRSSCRSGPAPLAPPSWPALALCRGARRLGTRPLALSSRARECPEDSWEGK
eukprot:4827880-Alexandrium_andersonii.AAC.1